MSEEQQDERTARRLSFKEYYERNKERIAKARKKRYSEDPEYRENVREQSRLRWKMGDRGRVVRRERKIQQIRAELNTEYHRKSTRKLMQRTVQLNNGDMILVYPMADLCLKVGVQKHSVKRWTQKGILPKPTMVDNRGRYWYSQEYIDDLAEHFDKCRAKNWSLEAFRDSLKEKLSNAKW